MQSPSKDSPTPNNTPSSSSSSPPSPSVNLPTSTPTTPTPPRRPNPIQAAGGVGGEGDGGFRIPIPWQMEELRGRAAGGGGGGRGGVVAAAAAAVGGLALGGQVAAKGRGKQVQDGKKKRKPSNIIDPPSGTPKCEICLLEFSSWKAAFGHMRAHPERPYRGFFRPPGFPSPSSAQPLQVQPLRPPQPQPQPRPQGCVVYVGSGSGRRGGSEGAGSSSGANELRGFDLNQPMVQRVEADAIEKDDRRMHEFDLNQLPPPEDDDQNNL